MASVMQCCRTSFFTATCDGNNIAHRLVPIQRFNVFRAHSKTNVIPTSITTPNTFGVRKAAHPSIVRCQSKTTSSTIESVQEIIARQLSVDVAAVQPQTKFVDLGADSLDTVEIVMSIEEEFGVSIPEDSAENISTVQEVADLIDQRIAGKKEQ